MDTVTCPNCGSEIPVPKKKVSSIKCPRCNMDGLELGLDYFDENDEPKKSFFKRHPKAAVAVLFAGWLAGKGILWWLNNKDELPSSPALETDSFNEPMTDSITDSETISEKTETHMNLDDYDTKVVNHPISIRNLSENQFPSMEKIKQAHDMGITLGVHQTIVNEHPQRHHTKKSE